MSSALLHDPDLRAVGRGRRTSVRAAVAGLAASVAAGSLLGLGVGLLLEETVSVLLALLTGP